MIRSSACHGLPDEVKYIDLCTEDSLLFQQAVFLFFNPYDVPRRLDPATWNLWMWQNRIGVLALAGLMLFAALRGMEVRERLLR